jgi:hypothetical protein
MDADGLKAKTSQDLEVEKGNGSEHTQERL